MMMFLSNKGDNFSKVVFIENFTIDFWVLSWKGGGEKNSQMRISAC